ncbi:hypothetical protein [uncultured Paracoccus sp.]|uniref:hypothetical protein n=1 Tax=uncultured Paracoccus sp. TaxID=189685 RepID=UPI0025D68898|nr:hypothetical protein [uncultured Paracoccus sp.]
MQHQNSSADRAFGLIGAAATALSLSVIAVAGWIAGTAIGDAMPTAEAATAFIAPTSHQIDVMGMTRLAERVGAE